MERKIGEIFEFGGEWYQCMKGNTCNDCAFYRSSCGSLNDKGSCRYNFREDATNVIFKKLEKVGEPIIYMSRTFQRLKSPDAEQCKYCYFGNQVCNPQLCGKESFLVEIKPTKEDMEEMKLNLKPFDIQKAREGKPVCTRDGRKARIICFDGRGYICPIIALIDENGTEVAYHFDEKGRNEYNLIDLDLMMLPEKKEGWVNVYNADNKVYITDYNIFNSQKEALDKACPKDYKATVKITWEE